MHKLKRLLFILLYIVVVLLFPLSECGGSGEEGNRDTVIKAGSTAIEIPIRSNSKNLSDDSITTSRENAITRAVQQISPTVVGITVFSIQKRRIDPLFSYFIPEKVQGFGSGFFISPDGLILTNEHVIHNAQKIFVTTTAQKQYEAELVGKDALYDVALLKIEGENFPYIRLGNSDDVIIGEWVIALGNPFGLFQIGLKPTVTVGVVSATGMDFKSSIEGRSYEDMIQTDAAINEGNSGGPLVNSLGQCIGINTFIFTGSKYSEGSVGIGFAIPINRVKQILPDLKRIGRVNRPYHIGIRVENINWVVAFMLGISQRDGVIVSKVEKDSPAERAGIRRDDIIVEINDMRVHNRSEYERIINSIDFASSPKLKMIIFRNGRLYEAAILLD